MAKKKNVQDFDISVTWYGIKQEYVTLKLNKTDYGYRLNCEKFQDFVKMLQKVRDTQKSISLGNMSIDKLNEREIKMLQNHRVEVEPCFFCKKSNPIYVINSNNNEYYSGNKFSLCRKHLIELTQILEELEENGQYEVKCQSKIRVTTYQEESVDKE